MFLLLHSPCLNTVHGAPVGSSGILDWMGSYGTRATGSTAGPWSTKSIGPGGSKLWRPPSLGGHLCLTSDLLLLNVGNRAMIQSILQSITMFTIIPFIPFRWAPDSSDSSPWGARRLAQSWASHQRCAGLRCCRRHRWCRPGWPRRSRRVTWAPGRTAWYTISLWSNVVFFFFGGGNMWKNPYVVHSIITELKYKSNISSAIDDMFTTKKSSRITSWKQHVSAGDDPMVQWGPQKMDGSVKGNPFWSHLKWMMGPMAYPDDFRKPPD